MNAPVSPSSSGCCASPAQPSTQSLRAQWSGRWAALDKPLLLIAAIVLAIAGLQPQQLAPTLRFAGSALAGIAPWLAVSVALAAYAKASRADALIARAFNGSPARMIVLASLFGALSPFCSCGVVPVIAGLLGGGVPLAPVMAFWMSSPLMDPNMFVVTAASLGLEFAVVKTVAAIGMGLLSGVVTYRLTAHGLLTQALRVTSSSGVPASNTAGTQWNPMANAAARAVFVSSAAANGWMLLRWMTVAFLLESLMLAYLPSEKALGLLGQDVAAIPLAILIGIPAYLNGFAALPLVRSLVDLGMSPAVGLAFLVSGGVTSIPAATAVWALVKPRVFALYLALAMTGSLLAAYAYSALLSFF